MIKNYSKMILVGIISGVLGSFIFHFFSGEKERVYITTETVPVKNFASLNNTSASQLNEDFAAASSLCTPSVVYITTTMGNQYQNSWFDWYFGGGQNSTSSGSGVIFSTDGYIVTNKHVIEKAEKIQVIHEKKTYQAKIVGTDPSTDLALLKIDAENLPAIKIGTSKNLNVGEWVLAVGNPFNLTSTVTAGIVSAKARNINIVEAQFPIESFIQTDAAINPGNSGGALVNIRGELVGINTAILSKTGSYTGYGFAVPVDIVNKVVKDIIKYGEVQKAFFGAEVSDLNTALAEQYKLNSLDGVIINYLQKEGAAEKIGLKKGDIILKLNDVKIDSKSGFDEYISYFNPGDKIKVTYKSDNKVKEGTLILTNREGTTEILKRETFSSDRLGAEFITVSKVEKDKLGISNGVRIVNIKTGLIRRLGISDGFIVTSINKVPINTPEELIDILEKVRGKVVIEGITSNGVRGYYSYFF
ncbi:MAG TPA: trypsin-like peptidase domain-containing protein [Cytophagaceae bacterium]